MNECGKCQYFDKSAYPKNPRFGKCTYLVPLLPVWIKSSSTNNVADYYVDCKTFSPTVRPNDV